MNTLFQHNVKNHAKDSNMALSFFLPTRGGVRIEAESRAIARCHELTQKVFFAESRVNLIIRFVFMVLCLYDFQLLFI